MLLYAKVPVAVIIITIIIIIVVVVVAAFYILLLLLQLLSLHGAILCNTCEFYRPIVRRGIIRTCFRPDEFPLQVRHIGILV